ncbi:MAG: hypothetical protein ACJ8F7_15615 [Gemmataceae bacterium]
MHEHDSARQGSWPDDRTERRSGVAEGQEVEISVRPVAPTGLAWPGAGLLRTAGALQDDPYWDAIMDEVHQERKK